MLQDGERHPLSREGVRREGAWPEAAPQIELRSRRGVLERAGLHVQHRAVPGVEARRRRRRHPHLPGVESRRGEQAVA